MRKFVRKPTKKRFAKAVMSVVNKSAEVKKQMVEWANNVTLYHNTIHNLGINAFVCKVGSLGDNIFPTTGGVRVGNEIFVKGLKMSIQLESQQYRPQVTYHLYLLKGINAPTTLINTKAQIYEGVSTTIPCDYIDPTKVKILFHKKFTLKMPNSGTTEGMEVSATGAGPNGVAFEYGVGALGADVSYHCFTNPKYAGKFYVPVNKTIKFIDYGDNALGITIGPHYYQWVITGYDNFTSTTGPPVGVEGYPLGHVTMTQQMIFTDV